MIYLDNAATTPLDGEVLEKMMPYLTEGFANSSSQYCAGRKTAAALLSARDKTAEIFGCKSEEVYFVSGGTEAGNWALKGACAANTAKGRHLIVSSIEHPALYESAADMRKFGYEVTYVDPDGDGVVSPESVRAAIRPDTVFCAVMHANNETGVIQPVNKIGEICKSSGVFYYCDCVQTAGVLPLPTAHCDALGISAHKFYGPKGVGAVYIRSDAKITRLMSGGAQERGLRGGTSDTASAIGCAFALERAYASAGENNKKISLVRDAFAERVLKEIEGTHLNGGKRRLFSNANISFDGCDGESILFNLDIMGTAVSTGSACSAGAVKQSRVLRAMGLNEDRIKSAVRFTFGKYNTLAEADEVVSQLKTIIERLRFVK